MTKISNDYYANLLRMLEDKYVAADRNGDLAGGSGSGGGLVRWERKRRVIAAAFDRGGTWLDVGCANGLLMETVTAWTAQKGTHLEPYGLELSPRIAERARIRVARWADRIWCGNVMVWKPPMRFDYVTLLPEYAPPELRATMIERVLRSFLNDGGRLIVCCYRPGSAPGAHTGDGPSAPALLRELGFTSDGAAEVRDDDGTRWTSVAWIDRKQPGL